MKKNGINQPQVDNTTGLTPEDRAELRERGHSFLVNCIVKHRKDDGPLFDSTGNGTFYLDGYAVLPVEEYLELKNDLHGPLIGTPQEENDKRDLETAEQFLIDVETAISMIGGVKIVLLGNEEWERHRKALGRPSQSFTLQSGTPKEEIDLGALFPGVIRYVKVDVPSMFQLVTESADGYELLKHIEE